MNLQTTTVATTTMTLIKYRIVIFKFCRTVKASPATRFYDLAETRSENTLVAEVNPLHARNPSCKLFSSRIFTACKCKISLLRILMTNYLSLFENFNNKWIVNFVSYSFLLKTCLSPKLTYFITAILFVIILFTNFHRIYILIFFFLYWKKSINN